MKKITVIACMLALANFTIVGCKKADTPVTSVQSQTSKMQEDLRKINSKYSSRSAVNLKITEDDKKKEEANRTARNAATATADVGALLESANLLSGLAVLGPVGGFAAGLVGGCLAAGASYGMYKTCGGLYVIPGNPYTSTEQQIDSRIAAHTGSFAVSNPHGNPWESVGERHNELVKILCSKITVGSPNSTSFVFDQSDLTTNELSAIQNNYVTSMSNIYTWTQNFTGATDTPGYKAVLNHYLAQDQTKLTIFTTLAEGLTQVNSVNDASALVNDYEDYFMNNTTLSVADINIILMGLAVAKHSYAFWDNALQIIF